MYTLTYVLDEHMHVAQRTHDMLIVFELIDLDTMCKWLKVNWIELPMVCGYVRCLKPGRRRRRKARKVDAERCKDFFLLFN